MAKIEAQLKGNNSWHWTSFFLPGPFLLGLGVTIWRDREIELISSFWTTVWQGLIFNFELIPLGSGLKFAELKFVKHFKSITYPDLQRRGKPYIKR